ncbi:hypothetical protein BC832DRAFT_535270 [Gaertneriomyces semiglobifer]|nr:hypothetical protein BC832DRAFT_535270 [Gaertneriomyces semiglobifer]
MNIQDQDSDSPHLFPHFGAPDEAPLPTYGDFFKNFLQANRPCVLRFELEPAFHDWTVDLFNGERKPNYEFLAFKFGHLKVLPSGRVNEISVGEFLDHLRNGVQEYLRDWHLVLEIKKHGIAYEAYKLPEWFGDDWLNMFYDAQEPDDDYRFVYMGASGTCTTIHVDVLTSYSWSANICGVKKWTFFPPGQESYLRSNTGEMLVDLRDASEETHPAYFEKATPIVIFQHPGEIVFVPSRWYHQVENIGPTISINQNWLNACNFESVHETLANDLSVIHEMIAEHREDMGENIWLDHCQLLMGANNAGWNWKRFWGFLEFHGRRLLKLLHPEAVPKAIWENEQYVRYSLRILLNVWQRLLSDAWIKWKIECGELSLASLREGLAVHDCADI